MQETSRAFRSPSEKNCVSDFAKKEKPLFWKRSLSNAIYRSNSSLVQLLSQTGLFAVGGILMNNALRRSLINHSGRRGQLLIGVGWVGGYSSIELANGSTHAALNDAIPQVFLLADLHALLRGLDIRQLGSPPLRILKNHRMA